MDVARQSLGGAKHGINNQNCARKELLSSERRKSKAWSSTGGALSTLSSPQIWNLGLDPEAKPEVAPVL